MPEAVVAVGPPKPSLLLKLLSSIRQLVGGAREFHVWSFKLYHHWLFEMDASLKLSMNVPPLQC